MCSHRDEIRWILLQEAARCPFPNVSAVPRLTEGGKVGKRLYRVLTGQKEGQQDVWSGWLRVRHDLSGERDKGETAQQSGLASSTGN